MPVSLNGRVGAFIDHRASKLKVSNVRPYSPSTLWRLHQGHLRTWEYPNWRDHTSCNCLHRDEYNHVVKAHNESERLRKREESMPKLVETKVGSRPGRGDGSTIEWLVTFDELLNGQFLTQAISKGLRLEVGEDFRVVDNDGNDVVIKTAAEKVARELKLAVAERLNRPTTIRVPKTGSEIAATDRQWIEFRPRDKFETDTERDEYVAALA